MSSSAPPDDPSRSSIAALTAASAVVGSLVDSNPPDVAHVGSALLTALLPRIDGARWASLTQPRRRAGYATVAVSDDLARRVDEVQYELGDGPCLRAVAGATVAADEATLRRMWPEFAQRVVVDTAVRSVLSLPLASGSTLGSLNVYSDRPTGFGDSARIAAAGVAVACGLALAALHQRMRADDLAAALESRSRIGAATGIVMARRRCTYDEAFEILRSASQRMHRKLRDLADEVLYTGAVPLG